MSRIVAREFQNTKKKIDMKRGGKKINFCAFFFSLRVCWLWRTRLWPPPASGQRFYFSRSFSEKKNRSQGPFSRLFSQPLCHHLTTLEKTKCEVMCTTGSEIDDCQCARIFWVTGPNHIRFVLNKTGKKWRESRGWKNPPTFLRIILRIRKLNVCRGVR